MPLSPTEPTGQEVTVVVPALVATSSPTCTWPGHARSAVVGVVLAVGVREYLWRMYPLRVEGHLDLPLSRWLWLVKWLLLIPHYVVLAVLWAAFFFVTVIAFFAILFTEHYPRGLFAFNVGVLRWTWRVSFYGYSALATDRYPPFSLGEEPDYPARLEMDYPERLSRGLVLVKWWLLAIPHYLVVGVFAGGFHMWGGGLVALLAIVAGIVLLFAERYPDGIFALILGLDRWVLRVTAYATLMTDEYPPFRLDQGGAEPGCA